jgi:hypothetical protein
MNRLAVAVTSLVFAANVAHVAIIALGVVGCSTSSVHPEPYGDCVYGGGACAYAAPTGNGGPGPVPSGPRDGGGARPDAASAAVDAGDAGDASAPDAGTTRDAGSVDAATTD